jgi:hypothetical protein
LKSKNHSLYIKEKNDRVKKNQGARYIGAGTAPRREGKKGKKKKEE